MRYKIGSQITKNGHYFGEIMAYGSDDGEFYLVDSNNMMILTNRATLDCDANGFNVDEEYDGYWASKAKENSK